MLSTCLAVSPGRPCQASAIFSLRRSSPLTMFSSPASWRFGLAVSMRRKAGRMCRSASSAKSAWALLASLFCSGSSLRCSPRDPGAIGFGTGHSPRPFGISLFVFFPGGPQLRDRISPRGAVGRGPIGGIDGFPVRDMRGDPFLQTDGGFRPAPPFLGRTRVRPVIAVIAAIGRIEAVGGIGAGSIRLVGIRLVDPHLSPARDTHWQTGAFTNGKRINSARGSPALAPRAGRVTGRGLRGLSHRQLAIC